MVSIAQSSFSEQRESRYPVLGPGGRTDPIQQRRRLRCLGRMAPLEELVEPGDHLRIRPTTRHVFEHTFEYSSLDRR
jgi:hypothetical protein